MDVINTNIFINFHYINNKHQIESLKLFQYFQLLYNNYNNIDTILKIMTFDVLKYVDSEEYRIIKLFLIELFINNTKQITIKSKINSEYNFLLDIIIFPNKFLELEKNDINIYTNYMKEIFDRIEKAYINIKIINVSIPYNNILYDIIALALLINSRLCYMNDKIDNYLLYIKQIIDEKKFGIFEPQQELISNIKNNNNILLYNGRQIHIFDEQREIELLFNEISKYRSEIYILRRLDTDRVPELSCDLNNEIVQYILNDINPKFFNAYIILNRRQIREKLPYCIDKKKKNDNVV